MKIEFPFMPKSTAYLQPGQFWQIPVDNGKFACGRVVQFDYRNGKKDSRCFLAGLMNWLGNEPPSADSIAGYRVIEQGLVHIKTIVENGGAILGYRSLEEDQIEPQMFLSQSPGKGCMLMQGCEVLRPATAKEQKIYPVFSGWGYKVIKIGADKLAKEMAITCHIQSFKTRQP
jgi:hypothetical protein